MVEVLNLGRPAILDAAQVFWVRSLLQNHVLGHLIMPDLPSLKAPQISVNNAEPTNGIQLSEKSIETMPAKDVANSPPDMSPRWAHWKQRKYARVWCAVLLTMNIEPSRKNRDDLKLLHPLLYLEYKDRIAIAKARVSVDIGYYGGHISEGTLAGEKYINLADFLIFAKGLNWTLLEKMEECFTRPEDRGSAAPTGKQRNDYLRLLHAVLEKAIDGFDCTDPSESERLLSKWLHDSSRKVVLPRTLKEWIAEMENAIEQP